MERLGSIPIDVHGPSMDAGKATISGNIWMLLAYYPTVSRKTNRWWTSLQHPDITLLNKIVHLVKIHKKKEDLEDCGKTSFGNNVTLPLTCLRLHDA